MILVAMQPYSVDILNIGKNIEGDLKSFLLQRIADEKID